MQEYERMAKLELSESEREALREQVKGLSALDGISVDGAAPLVTVLEIENVLREDAAHKTFSRETLLSNAPEQYDGYYQVPRTVE